MPIISEGNIEFAEMKTKSITIIPLARRKLAQRGISESMVSETIHQPDQVVEGHKDRVVAQRKYFFDDCSYLLRIIYEENDNNIIVVTGYLTSQVSRYWEG